MSDEPREIDVDTFAARLDADDVQVVDVRTDEEWRDGHLPRSRHVTFNELTAAAETIEKDRAVVFVCAGGNRSATAAEAFRTAGYDAYSLAGGLTAWTSSGKTLESG